ncbi:sulfur oxidation c-type cytochrome SoxX [Acidihalobacter yilgarnensis]|uniref:Sulfur oxidation c-type cytochrome SoxX n=1 Tax=Acidihalobacter yilgarnensis TaxID=2819280 RepID=A0A1D8IT87_9GAMM|nr:sulfur oxidation c-type cytochrome SoxX [Acidihalobacter yilgarnensis]AOU99686.1 sulfur oxidation c-type cytochrome SoxX [Acidihalobacter yilgarnensis]
MKVNPCRGFPILCGTVFLVAVLLAAVLAADRPAAAPAPASAANIAAGRHLVFSREAGNCIACHMVKGAVMAGDIAQPLAPPFPDRQRLFAQIWDARQNYANTIMPPFGANHLLTRKQIHQIMDFLYSLK